MPYIGNLIGYFTEFPYSRSANFDLRVVTYYCKARGALVCIKSLREVKRGEKYFENKKKFRRAKFSNFYVLS